MVIVKTAISNSLTRGREHDGREFMMEQYVAQGGRCAVTGERFSSSHRDLIPSPDRIDNSKGYVKGNVHWVMWFVNDRKGSNPLWVWDPLHTVACQ